MERLATLKHLSAVYAMVEEIRSLEARRAAFAVAEAQSAIHAEEARTHEARVEMREAMLRDDSRGWPLAVVREEIADRRRKQFEPVLEQRKERNEEARERYLTSRLWSERMKCLVEKASSERALEIEKRSQLEMNDRFLARRRWQGRTGGGQFREMSDP